MKFDTPDSYLRHLIELSALIGLAGCVTPSEAPRSEAPRSDLIEVLAPDGVAVERLTAPPADRMAANWGQSTFAEIYVPPMAANWGQSTFVEKFVPCPPNCPSVRIYEPPRKGRGDSMKMRLEIITKKPDVKTDAGKGDEQGK